MLQLHCWNHSLLHMAFFRAQFSVQCFSACAWTIYPISHKAKPNNIEIMTLRYIFLFASKDIDSCHAKLLRIYPSCCRVVLCHTTFLLILTKPRFSWLWCKATSSPFQVARGLLLDCRLFLFERSWDHLWCSIYKYSSCLCLEKASGKYHCMGAKSLHSNIVQV